MKKLLFLLSVCLIGFSVYAEGDKPIVIIHKTNGGYWAWLNLYNDILYTPSMEENTPATLDCSGAGWSACRVPRQNTYTMNCAGQVPSAIAPLISDAINEILAKSEERGSRGSLRGSASKTIALRGNSNNGYDTYVVQGEWKYNAYGEGTVMIYLTRSDILQYRR